MAFLTFSTFSMSICTPFLSAIRLSSSTLGCMKEHFLILSLNAFYSRIQNMFSWVIACSSLFFENITASPILHHLLECGLRIQYSKRYHFKLKCSIPYIRTLLFPCKFHPYRSPIPLKQMNSRKYRDSSHIIQNFVD